MIFLCEMVSRACAKTEVSPNTSLLCPVAPVHLLPVSVSVPFAESFLNLLLVLWRRALSSLPHLDYQQSLCQ